MGWQVVVVALSVLVVVVGLVLIVAAVKVRGQPDPPDDSEAEDFLTEYFALEEFDDAQLQERLEHLRGVPELR